MTPEQKNLVRFSFAAALVDRVATGELFYKRLFEIAPAVKPLFPKDMTTQNRKLIDMLELIVGGLDNLVKIVPIIRREGKKHANYGAKPEHFEAVGAAWLWTLEQILQDEFTPDIKDAWKVAYHLIASTMIYAISEEKLSLS